MIRGMKFHTGSATFCACAMSSQPADFSSGASRLPSFCTAAGWGRPEVGRATLVQHRSREVASTSTGLKRLSMLPDGLGSPWKETALISIIGSFLGPHIGPYDLLPPNKSVAVRVACAGLRGFEVR